MTRRMISPAGRRIGELGKEFASEFMATWQLGKPPAWWGHRFAGNGADRMILAGSHEHGRGGISGPGRLLSAPGALPGWKPPAHLARRPMAPPGRHRHGPFAPWSR